MDVGKLSVMFYSGISTTLLHFIPELYGATDFTVLVFL